MQSSACNPRALWKAINEMMPQKDKSSNNLSKTEQANLCKLYNDHFVTVGQKASENASKYKDKYTEQYNSILSTRPKDGNYFEIKEVTETQVEKLIMNMPDKKAAGMDGIKPIHLKKSLDVTLPVITNIMNSCIRQSVMPKSWKIAQVKPIQKIKNNMQAANQRPIALLPIMSKTLERLIYDQFIKYLEDDGRISMYQNGSRKKQSTETTLIKITNDIHRATDHGKATAMVSSDCSKAFDSISHPKMLQRLENLGLSEKSYSWLVSYLSERQQCTSMETEMSSIKSIKYGVPQGSVLGGLLFCLYVDPLLAEIEIKREIYIDDLTIYHSFKPGEAAQIESLMNYQCKKIHSWYSANDLQLNATKTKYMLFGQPKAIEKVNEMMHIQINQSKIEPSSTIKLLGVILDQKLAYKDHIENVTEKCSRLLYRLNRMRTLLTKSTVEKVINATVMSRLMYCATFLTSANKESIHLMQCTQNYAMKIVTRNYLCTNLTPVYKRMKWLRVQEMIEEKVLLSTYKSMKGIHPKKLAESFNQRVQNTTTTMRLRNRQDLNVPRQNTSQSSLRYEVEGAKLWNQYGSKLSSQHPTQAKFKRALRQHLLLRKKWAIQHHLSKLLVKVNSF